jgi:hypothetical protein
MGVFIVLLIFAVIIVGPIVLAYQSSARAKVHHETVIDLSPARVRATVDDSFGKLFWSDVQGPGDVNKRRRTPNGNGATISIALEPTADGKTHVEAWMSAWTSNRMGIVMSAGSQQAKKVIRKLEAA